MDRLFGGVERTDAEKAIWEAENLKSETQFVEKVNQPSGTSGLPTVRE